MTPSSSMRLGPFSADTSVRPHEREAIGITDGRAIVVHDDDDDPDEDDQEEDDGDEEDEGEDDRPGWSD